MNFIWVKTTTGNTLLNTDDISAITIAQTPWYEIHMSSGTIFRTMDEESKLRDWMMNQQGWVIDE